MKISKSTVLIGIFSVVVAVWTCLRVSSGYTGMGIIIFAADVMSIIRGVHGNLSGVGLIVGPLIFLFSFAPMISLMFFLYNRAKRLSQQGNKPLVSALTIKIISFNIMIVLCIVATFVFIKQTIKQTYHGTKKITTEGKQQEKGGAYVNVPAFVGLDRKQPKAFTISAWVYTPTIASAEMILYQGGGWGGVGFYLNVYDGYLYVTTNTSQARDAVSFPINSWQFVAATYNGTNTLTLYRNGTPVASNSFANNYIPTTAPLEIGEYRLDRIYQPWSGAINDFHIYNHALSANEIADLYKGSLEQHRDNPLEITPPIYHYHKPPVQGPSPVVGCHDTIGMPMKMPNGNIGCFTMDPGNKKNWHEIDCVQKTCS